MKDKNLCRLYIVRHGESEANVLEKQRIEYDPVMSSATKLTDTGRKQAGDLAEKLREIKFGAVFASNFVRAQETAAILKEERDLAILTTEAIRERSHGSWSGKFFQVKKKIDEAIRRLSEEKKMQYVFDDVETEEHAVSRFITYIREIAVGYSDKTVLVVTHGNVMRSFLVKIGFGTYDQVPSGSLENVGYIVVDSDGTDFFLKETSGVRRVE